jgi:hypothetical protein
MQYALQYKLLNVQGTTRKKHAGLGLLSCVTYVEVLLRKVMKLMENVRAAYKVATEETSLNIERPRPMCMLSLKTPQIGNRVK